MTLAMIIMIVLICAGCALTIAGLVIVGYQFVLLNRAARKAGITTKAEVQEITRRTRDLAPRLRELRKKREAVAEGLQTISATTGELKQLKGEIDRVAGFLPRLKF